MVKEVTGKMMEQYDVLDTMLRREEVSIHDKSDATTGAGLDF
ncbi:MAG TPA: hypothetical protein VD816_18260 [Ohtaekwangia sp.]|nr:hypothetical protein [Ohtaekwangia sp.]